VLSRLSRPLSGLSGTWSSLDRDRRNAVLLVGGIGLVLLLALAVVAYGFYQERIAGKGAVVLKVGEREFTYADLERRLRYEVGRGSLRQISNPYQLPTAVLGAMQREELIRLAASSLGIEVSEAEVEEAIGVLVGAPPEVSRERFAAAYRRAILASGLSVSEFREVIATRLLETKLREHFLAPIPPEGEAVNLRLIRTANQGDAITLKRRVDAGEAFRLVAASELNTSEARESAGQLGWVPRGALTSILEEVAFTLPVGAVSDIVETPDGFYLLFVEERAVRPYGEEERDQIAGRGLQNAMDDARARFGAVASLSQTQATGLLEGLLGR
jgi:hypothetical protein